MFGREKNMRQNVLGDPISTVGGIDIKPEKQDFSTQSRCKKKS
jgi:hypothetical protein